jgi:hypothetical protein
MKTTLELPDPLQEKLSPSVRESASAEPAWMNGFGKLGALHAETARVQQVIAAEFEVVEPEDLE